MAASLPACLGSDQFLKVHDAILRGFRASSFLSPFDLRASCPPEFTVKKPTFWRLSGEGGGWWWSVHVKIKILAKQLELVYPS